MTTVNQILKVKGDDVRTVTPDTSIGETLKLMAKYNIGAVPVMHGKELVGIISERDYARKSVLQEALTMDIPVKELMTKKVSSVQPTETVEACLALMTDKRIRHLPVLDNGDNLIGIISIGDLVKSVISQQKFIIEQLEEYVVSSG